MIIYFFKDRSKERVNFGQLIDEYFDKLENTVITSNDDEFIATFNIPHFGCSYRLSHYKAITSFLVYIVYNPNYVNTFLTL
ncbi:MAG: hypothetical protein ACLU5J_00800 [Christensenellales bacterium]